MNGPTNGNDTGSSPASGFAEQGQSPLGEPRREQRSFFTTPLSRKGWPVWLVYGAALLGGLYILNPTFGVFELIPDQLPLIGNIDEGAAFMLLWFGLMEIFEGRRGRSKP